MKNRSPVAFLCGIAVILAASAAHALDTYSLPSHVTVMPVFVVPSDVPNLPSASDEDQLTYHLRWSQKRYREMLGNCPILTAAPQGARGFCARARARQPSYRSRVGAPARRRRARPAASPRPSRHARPAGVQSGRPSPCQPSARGLPAGAPRPCAGQVVLVRPPLPMQGPLLALSPVRCSPEPSRVAFGDVSLSLLSHPIPGDFQFLEVSTSRRGTPYPSPLQARRHWLGTGGFTWPGSRRSRQ